MLGVKVALLAVIGCLVIGLVQAQYLDKRMGWLNERLMESTDSDDVNANFEAAAQYLTMLEKRSRGLKGWIAPPNPELIASVRNFLRLKSVMNGGQCSAQTFDILDHVDGTTNGGARNYYKTGVQPTMRIQKVVLEVVKKHAEICAKLFPDLLAPKINELPADFKDFVKLVGGTVMGDHFYIVQYYKRIINSMISTKEGTTRVMTRDDYNKYLLAPCADLAGKIDDGLVAAAKGQKMECNVPNAGDQYRTNCNNKAAVDFCRHVSANKEEIWNGITKKGSRGDYTRL